MIQPNKFKPQSNSSKLIKECIASLTQGIALVGFIILLGIVCRTIKFLFMLGWRFFQ